MSPGIRLLQEEALIKIPFRAAPTGNPPGLAALVVRLLD
jgi:hypothetical protein